MMTSLPEDAILDIIARVSRFDYPILSIVSKHFRSLVASPRGDLCWAAPNSVSMMSATTATRVVAISIFSAGKPTEIAAWTNNVNRTTSALTIDCRSHTAQPLPSLPVLMSGLPIADIIDGRIYVIGDCHYYQRKKAVVVFNTETQTWEKPAMKRLDIELGNTYYGCVVMAGKLYTRDSDNSFAYDPKENKWETDEILNLQKWYNACVIDDVLYYYDCIEFSRKNIDTLTL
ncbi:unnamed protein product [Thlaspi arvense]|uniref:F-box domain-containing protein n=1 Tax=Thlaspi arvense TaxID=13288 RepID=A0AAU9SBW5_THLAR|nr:unnamed protein product [Thlaspi arvense]